MLKVAKVTKNDVVYDLGSGDGRIPITAAKTYGARGVGIDIDPQRIKEATENLKNAGVGDRVKFLNQDLFTTDISEAADVEPPADSEVEQGAQARDARRVTCVRHGVGQTARDAERQRPNGVLLDHSHSNAGSVVRPGREFFGVDLMGRRGID